mmetsp:Transcript_94946/g.245205  ORF Transcript_94946/g.245205 Transcript_94946/m.245205 type:complete len:210 (+) Transcript_94946:479-1108(+)
MRRAIQVPARQQQLRQRAALRGSRGLRRCRQAALRRRGTRGRGEGRGLQGRHRTLRCADRRRRCVRPRAVLGCRPRLLRAARQLLVRRRLEPQGARRHRYRSGRRRLALGHRLWARRQTSRGGFQPPVGGAGPLLALGGGSGDGRAGLLEGRTSHRVGLLRRIRAAHGRRPGPDHHGDEGLCAAAAVKRGRQACRPRADARAQAAARSG